MASPTPQMSEVSSSPTLASNDTIERVTSGVNGLSVDTRSVPLIEEEEDISPSTLVTTSTLRDAGSEPWFGQSDASSDTPGSSSMASSVTLNSFTRLPTRISGLSTGEAQQRILQLQQDIWRAGTELPQRSRKGLFKTACSTDLLFLIDTTGSMAGHINAAKDQVKSIVRDISAAFFNEAEVRISIVGYKDHLDKPNIQFLDFTPYTDRVHKFLNDLTATGGNDLPEDVLGGLKQALNASWKHQTRCIIHIADAPPHGSELHDLAIKDDSYIKPGSEPHGLTHQPLIEKMIKMNMNYVLLRINNSTDRMAFTIFKEYDTVSTGSKLHTSNRYYVQAAKMASTSKSGRRAYGGLLCEERELGTSYSSLRHLVVGSVTSSASRTAIRTLSSTPRRSKGGSTGSSNKRGGLGLDAIDEDEDVKDTSLDDSPPQWSLSKWFNETLMVEGFSPDVLVHGSKTLKEMMANNDNIQMNIVELTIHKRSRPFSQGALRLASYARTAASNNRFVVKSYKKGGKHLAHLAEDMRAQALCKAFALEWNSLVGELYQLDFIVTTCLKGNASDRGGEEFMALEPYINGTYIKYNNNSGYVNDSQGSHNLAAQAFSHFTFERSCGRFLVCDLQGVGGLLTDPAIHTRSSDRFKLCDTNLGKEGFKFFFATHTCNHLCKVLQLRSESAMFLEDSFDFRQRWPKPDSSVCCSSKLCGRIVRAASAKVHHAYPGKWCESCFVQLDQFKTTVTCTQPGEHHEFVTSAFFHESQGRSTPHRCSDHGIEDEIVKSSVVKSETIGAMLWGKLKAARRRSSKFFDKQVDWLQ